MPRRPRQPKGRRTVDGLGVLCTYAQVSDVGCMAIADDVTLEDLRWAWDLSIKREGDWGWWAFERQHPRPCEVMTGAIDPFDGEPMKPPSCQAAGAKCAAKELP
jgi:hypothetical protein